MIIWSQLVRSDGSSSTKSMDKIPKHLQFSQKQVFGSQQSIQHIQEQDIINQIQFDPTGELLAIGDNAGRIILFRQLDDQFNQQKSFQYYAQFQSHVSQFDSLKSLQMDQSIMQIKWLIPQGYYRKLITANKNTIKLWKVFEKTVSRVVDRQPQSKFKLNHDNTEEGEIVFPVLKKQTSFDSKPQVIFPIKHQGSINKVQVAESEQYIFSTDQTTGICWNLEDFRHPFIIQDTRKKKNWTQGQQISCFKLHPHSDNIFTIGTTMGGIELNDMRTSFNNRKNTQFMSQKLNEIDNDYFHNMSKRINSLQFLSQGRYIVARDYMTVKVWDICRATQPLTVVEVNPNLQGKFCNLFQNDCIEDKFNMSTFCENLIVTGAYDNRFHIIDPLGNNNVEFSMDFEKRKTEKHIISEQSNTLLNHFDAHKKVLACGVHSKSRKIALSTLNSFFIYAPTSQDQSLKQIQL